MFFSFFWLLLWGGDYLVLCNTGDMQKGLVYPFPDSMIHTWGPSGKNRGAGRGAGLCKAQSCDAGGNPPPVVHEI